MSQHCPKQPLSDPIIQTAQAAVEQAEYLHPGDDLSTPGRCWHASSVLGLDTEFVRERTFYPRPGLLQLSDGKKVWLLDPIGREDSEILIQVLQNPDVTKVLHSVGEDLEIFSLVANALPAPLFDTQIAAAMLGMPLQCRYESLVLECFGVELPGGQARSDWCQRPLGAGLLTYAAQDVIWLPRLEQLLRSALENCGRLAWLEEDCQRLVDRARDGDGKPLLLRVKGAGRLETEALAWLERLSGWREDQARTHDLPRGFVVRDDVLMSIAEGATDGQPANKLVNLLPPRERRRHGDSLEAVLQTPPPEPVERPLELARMSNEERQALKQAQQEVRRIAEQANVDPALIASKRELARLISGQTPEWLNGWRGELIGHLAGI